MSGTPTIVHLIRNNTLNAEMAATLWSMVLERTSFISFAIPRLAGKTTVATAILELLGSDVPIEKLDGTLENMLSYKEKKGNGYLTISEISKGPFQDYVWGEEVRVLFEVLDSGYSLMATMHATSVTDVFNQICVDNNVEDVAAENIGMVFYIKRFGDDESNYWRRVSEIHQIHNVKNGIPTAQLLYRWIDDEDRFESVSEPKSATMHTSRDEITRRTMNLGILAQQSGGRDDIWIENAVERLVSEDLEYRTENY